MKTAGMVWRCDSAGVVVEVVSSDFAFLSDPIVGFPFYQLLSETYVPVARQWWAQAEAAKPLLAPVYFSHTSVPDPFVLGSSPAGGSHWLFWQQGSLPEAVVPPNDLFPKEKHFTPKAVLWEPTPDQAELLEELSRVNNELVNARRELIRQNIELHRAHQKLSKASPSTQ